MAHNLNFNEENNEHSFFSVKEKAWHGLGKIVESYPTSAETRFTAEKYSFQNIKMKRLTLSKEAMSH